MAYQTAKTNGKDHPDNRLKPKTHDDLVAEKLRRLRLVRWDERLMSWRPLTPDRCSETIRRVVERLLAQPNGSPPSNGNGRHAIAAGDAPLCRRCHIKPPHPNYDGWCEDCWVAMRTYPSSSVFRRAQSLPADAYREWLWGDRADGMSEHLSPRRLAAADGKIATVILAALFGLG
jgi:hypothetical protein